MRIKLSCCISGNSHNSRKEYTYTFQQLGVTEQEWKEMTEEEKEKIVWETMIENFETWYEEIT